MEAPAGAVPLPRADALAQLRKAWEVLSAQPQGEGDPILAYARAASADVLLKHPERDVRLWSARCLAEVLRIFAPSPPLEAERLRKVMELFVEQLGTLEEAGSNAFVHAVGLLERLVEIRAFMLVFDCSRPEELLASLVEVCLRVARARGGGRLEALLAELLAVVLSEADDLPPSALAPLLQELAQKRPAAQQGARGVIRRVLGSLAGRSAASLVHNFLAGALRPTSDAGAAGPASAPQLEPASALEAAHELFLVEPALVLRALPVLQAELHSPDIQRRSLATRLIGRVLSHQPPVPAAPAAGPADGEAKASLLETHPLLFDQYLERYEDVADEVRLAALDAAPHLFAAAAAAGCHAITPSSTSAVVSLASAAARVRRQLAERGLDPSLAVRLRAVEVAAEAAGGSAAALELLAPALPEIFRRALDRKALVREACIEAAAMLYKDRALPALTRGSGTEALAWVPPLLCEAHAVLAGGRLGGTAQLEETIERSLLGCDEGLEAGQRTLVFLGFYAAASSQESGARGLSLLLRRKADANAALRRFVGLRKAKGAPILVGEEGCHALVPLGSPAAAGRDGADREGTLAKVPAPQSGPVPAALETMEMLLRLSPAAEDRGGARPEALAAQLRALDAVRDRSLWELMERLFGLGEAEVSDPNSDQEEPAPVLATADMGPLLGELGRLLRVNRLTDLVPLLRRALLASWLLPDQASALLRIWRARAGRSEAGMEGAVAWAGAARRLVAELPGYFPGCFMPHVGEILEQLSAATAEAGAEEDARAALRALGALGKWRVKAAEGQSSSAVSQALIGGIQLAEALLRAPLLSGAGGAEAASAEGCLCRRAAWALGLLSAEERMLALGRILGWVEERLASMEEPAEAAAALRLAAACLEQRAEGEGCAETVREAWLSKACAILRSSPGHPAALELLVALGAGEAELLEPLTAGADEQAGLHAAGVALRAVRRGALRPSSALLSGLASRALAAASSGNTQATEMLLGALQKFQKPTSSRMRLADRLRICSTLPTAFAFSASRQHSDAAQRLLQLCLAKAVRQGSAQQEPLLDFAVACFLHFLSRLELFAGEAAAPASAFPKSSRAAAFFLEALVRSDASNGMDLAGAALRAADGIRLVADRERPDPGALDKAAAVLRHVIEKRYPECCKAGTPRQWLPPSCVPSELFVVRRNVCSSRGASAPPVRSAAQAAAPAPPSPSLPLLALTDEPALSASGAEPPSPAVAPAAAPPAAVVPPPAAAVPPTAAAPTAKAPGSLLRGRPTPPATLPAASAATAVAAGGGAVVRLFQSLGRGAGGAKGGARGGGGAPARLPGEVAPGGEEVEEGTEGAEVEMAQAETPRMGRGAGLATTTPKKQRCSRACLMALAAQAPAPRSVVTPTKECRRRITGKEPQRSAGAAAAKAAAAVAATPPKGRKRWASTASGAWPGEAAGAEEPRPELKGRKRRARP